MLRLSRYNGLKKATRSLLTIKSGSMIIARDNNNFLSQRYISSKPKIQSASAAIAFRDDAANMPSSFLSIDPSEILTPSKRKPLDSQKYVYSNLPLKGRDFHHLESMLDAFLSAGVYKRAETILSGLLTLSDKSQFLSFFNKYLYTMAQDDKCSLNEVEQAFNKLSYQFLNVSANAGTWSVLIYAAFRKTDEDVNIVQQYLTLALARDILIEDILKNFSLLGVDCMAMIIQQNEITEEQIPSEMRELLSQYIKLSEGDALRSQVTQDTIAELKKDELPTSLVKGDIKQLRSVETFGMKAIRTTLKGLQDHMTPEKTKEFLQKINTDEETGSILYESADKKNIDFFEIYKSLPEEDKPQFEEELENFNFDRQRVIELRAFESARERWRMDMEEMKSRGEVAGSKKIGVDLWIWLTNMVPLIEEEIKRVDEHLISAIENDQKIPKNFNNSDRTVYGPYIKLISPEKMASITILELLKLNATGGIADGMKTARACLEVGKAIQMEYRSEMLSKAENAMIRNHRNSKSPAVFRKLLATIKYKNPKLNNSDRDIEWPLDICAKIGSVLIAILISVSKVRISGVDPDTGQKVYGEVPAFHHCYQFQKGARIGVLKLHSSLRDRLASEPDSSAVSPQNLPMLVKPVPWTSWNKGGYIYSRSKIIRTKNSREQAAYAKAASENGVLDDIFTGLNVLGDTSWTVNKELLTVITKVWNEGSEFLQIPADVKKPVLPPRPPKGTNPAELQKWQNSCIELINNYQRLRSQRCDINYKLEIARAFLGEKCYFPHNMDFRGRAYPISPHFNHLGNDLTRSLLKFWKGRALGEHGLDWLYIHLANLFGLDKTSFDNRKAFGRDHIEDIFDSADHPLDGKKWWMTGDKPWQALATCIEIASALRSPDPSKFISHQPVHQDGTCNGLQHYAALGGDVIGATQVNLVPSETPNDVYSHVAQYVRELVEEDFKNGDENTKRIAGLMRNNITRKLVKQTVMTNVYGVTYIGAKQQIFKQMKDNSALPKDDMPELVRYITGHVFKSIKASFEAAHLIQDWIGDCAKLITKSIRLDMNFDDQGTKTKAPKYDSMNSVIWTTPLGLPIVQPYREDSRRQVNTNLQTVYILDPFKSAPVDKRRQASAIAPNFIHSLDATHMIMSAIECGKLGLQFASVHDSYWTHAADVDTMNKVLRESFIKLHKVDLIQTLKNEFDTRYNTSLIQMKIKANSKVAKEIKEFKRQKTEELGSFKMLDEILLEKQRQKLIRSENPEDRAKGNEMITTVSIIEKAPIPEIVTKSVPKKKFAPKS